MSKIDDLKQITEYTKKLQQASLELRSKLTAIILYNEQSTALNSDEKECIDNITKVIKMKGDELVYCENKLLEVIEHLVLEKEMTAELKEFG
ncbi:hypothetical protein [Fulvivirga ligni]|uniref:hypothetical protein n=1 Tax=Fulvivirga ligni TaxID=2904246 RepID=UPI001F3B1BFD|nr:hypothetical protein [Fulvivirga ligni]UII19018.1 hypothetical protein LVD16_14330 [Fulvivirga ligni]UII20828.1 hypothetical protein LVD16_23590 [Fulvivirga ligni]